MRTAEWGVSVLTTSVARLFAASPKTYDSYAVCVSVLNRLIPRDLSESRVVYGQVRACLSIGDSRGENLAAKYEFSSTSRARPSAYHCLCPTRYSVLGRGWTRVKKHEPIRTNASGHTYTFTRQPNGTTDIDVVVVREGKNLKGWVLGLVLGTAFENSVKAIEARKGAATAAGAS
jgi:hypothetical protein